MNDHVLKEQYPGRLTGKLSDFAGLLFFPFLLGWLFGLVSQSRRSMAVAFWTTGIWFTAIKTSSYAASATESLVSRLGGIDSQVVVDPTDLIGLAALAAGWQLWRRVAATDHTSTPIINQRVVLAVAAMASMATSDYEPPAVIDIVEDDQLYAVVQRGFYDEGWDTYTTLDGGATWAETDVATWYPASFDPWATPMARCEPGDTAVCTAKHLIWEYEVSSDGGVTWNATGSDDVSPLFTGDRYVRLYRLACAPNDCFRQMGESGSTHEVSTDRGVSWQAKTVPPNLTLESMWDARCDFEDTRVCFRRETNAEEYARSLDGGITWLPPQPTNAAIPDIWKSFYSGDRWQLGDLLCVTDSECYRIFDPEGEEVQRLELSTDQGRTWATSWTPSPRFGASRAPAPNGLAVDPGIGNLVVAVGYSGAVIHTDDDSWRQHAVGQANRPIPSVFSLSGNLLFSWVAWLLVVVQAARFWVRAGRDGRERRGKPTLLRGSAALATAGLLAVALATQHYPYGLTIGPDTLKTVVHGTVYFGFPIASIAAVYWWAKHNVRPIRIARITISSAAIVLVLATALPALGSLPA